MPHPDVAGSYRNIGNVYDSQGRYEEALFHHQKALEVFLALFGQEHPDVAKSRNGIGNVLVRMGKHEEALVQYQKALEVFLAVHGQEHPSVAATYNNTPWFCLRAVPFWAFRFLSIRSFPILARTARVRGGSRETLLQVRRSSNKNCGERCGVVWMKNGNSCEVSQSSG